MNEPEKTEVEITSEDENDQDVSNDSSSEESITDDSGEKTELESEQDEKEEKKPELTPEEALQLELAEVKDQMLRTRADFDNYRKRMAREMERVRKVAAEVLIHDILPGIDNLDLALQHADDQSAGLAQGVQMVYKQLQDALAGHGLTPIEALGKPFDPNLHEAVSQAPSEEHEKDHVAQVFQTGYTLGDVVLRPSKVVVSTGSPEAEPENTTEQSASAD